jgi:hypothetical protein
MRLPLLIKLTGLVALMAAGVFEVSAQAIKLR